MGLLDAMGSAADLLSAPGGYLRGLLAGDPGSRYTGHELLQSYGMDPGDDVAGTLAGVGVDVATDPLTYVGGYLARRLMGGGFRPTAVGPWEGETQSLLAGKNFETGTLLPREPLNPRVVHYPEVVPEPEPQLGAWAPDALERGASIRATMPTSIPDPEGYAHLTGGITGDMALDGVPAAQRFGAGLGQWDQVLTELRGLPPDQQVLLRVSQNAGSATDVARYAHVQPSLAGEQWGHLLKERAGDLQAANSLSEAIPGFMDNYYRPVGEQLAQIDQVLMHDPVSPASEAARDIMRGFVRPGDAMAKIAPGGELAHLPIDPAMLRRLAAARQEQAMIGDFSEGLSHLSGGEVPAAELAHHYETPYLIQQLQRLIDPTEYSHYEPGIVRRVLAATPESAYSRSNLAMESGDAANIAQVRELLSRLLPHTREYGGF
jgi:hypothetical protein